MNPTIYAIRITTISELLGSVPLDAEIYTTYIASKAPAIMQTNGTAAAEADTLAEYDALELAIRRGTRIIVRRRGTDFIVIAERLVLRDRREAIEARHVDQSHPEAHRGTNWSLMQPIHFYAWLLQFRLYQCQLNQQQSCDRFHQTGLPSCYGFLPT